MILTVTGITGITGITEIRIEDYDKEKFENETAGQEFYKFDLEVDNRQQKYLFTLDATQGEKLPNGNYKYTSVMEALIFHNEKDAIEMERLLSEGRKNAKQYFKTK